MKAIAQLIIGILFCFSSACGQNGQYEYENNACESEAPYARVSSYEDGPADRSNTIEMKELRDPKTGLVNMHMPFPSSWKITGNGIEGPRGTTVKEYPGGSYTGQQRSLHSIEQVIEQDIMPVIQKNGARYLRTIDLPEVARRNKRLGDQYWQAMPMQKHYQAKGIEIIDAEDKPGLIVVHFVHSQNQYGTHAFFYQQVLISNKAHYENDKQTLLFALANQQSNPEAVLAFNRKMQQEYLRRQRLFDNRIGQAWANFNAWNKAHVETWNDISESSIDSWRRRETMRDNGQSSTVDAIHERERLIDPFDGRHLEVEAGYKYYYTNGLGETIGTNSEFYDPERDSNVNHQEWRQMRPRGNN